jgi:hypothetical protein
MSLTQASSTRHVAYMNENTHPVGWVVQVITPGQPSQKKSAFDRFAGVLGPPSYKYFNVAIATAEAAVAATTTHLDDSQRLEMSVVRRLSSAEIASLGLAAGDVKPA